MEKTMIISVKEFRKLAGKESDAFSDEQIIELINGLDLMAELFIKSRIKKGENDMVPKVS